jgi:hypothetical protein
LRGELEAPLKGSEMGRKGVDAELGKNGGRYWIALRCSSASKLTNPHFSGAPILIHSMTARFISGATVGNGYGGMLSVVSMPCRWLL